MQEKSLEEIDGKETGKAAASVPREERKKDKNRLVTRDKVGAEAGSIGEEADIERDKQEKMLEGEPVLDESPTGAEEFEKKQKVNIG